MFEYRKENRYFAQISGTLENIAKKELKKLGAKNLDVSNRGCHFTADNETLYRIILQAKTPQRILAPLVKFKCFSTKYLGILCYKDIHWSQLFKLDEKFGIVCNVRDSNITNSHYASQVMKDSICDQWKLKTGERPSFSIKEADILFNLHIQDNDATISIDLCGTSMHKRGYKINTVRAPLQETIANALLQQTGWDGSKKLIDFMCGSGTFLGEAVQNYCGLPNDILKPNTHIKRLPNFDQKLWDYVQDDIKKNMRKLPDNLIYGNDISPTNVVAAMENVRKLPQGENVIFDNRNFKNIKYIKDSVILINPPYGIRLNDMKTTKELYRDLGIFFREKCSNSEAYVLSGSRELIDAIPLKPDWVRRVRNGNLDAAYAKYILD
jgi:putative N6-adenine-specific DNA methylase